MSPLTPLRDPSSGSPLLGEVSDACHAVQFYEAEAFLCETVGRFLAAGIDTGDRLVLVAEDARRAGILHHLDRSLRGGRGELEGAGGKLLVLEARQTLSRFMVGGSPDPELFQALLLELVDEARGPDGRPGRIRAYGEMVNLLWRAGNSRAALGLEELWDEACREFPLSLLCGYAMDTFRSESDWRPFFEVCGRHDQVRPTEAFSQLDDGGDRLRQVAALQQRARALDSEIDRRRRSEEERRQTLRERGRAESELRTSLRREREVRGRAEASDDFIALLVDVLGRDVRDPLRAIVASAQKLAREEDLGPEGRRRLDGVIASGVRVELVAKQLLDASRARLGAGIPLEPAWQDVAVLVGKVVREARLAHPARAFELELDGPCDRRVDGARFEQVASTLVSNAIAHGDPERPVRIRLRRLGHGMELSVQNFGRPIPAEVLPVLFDPFRRRAGARSEGLGLGIYVAERIVAAHGGVLDVESSVEKGTRFTVTLPGASAEAASAEEAPPAGTRLTS